jgi:hypothetical protein
LREVKMDYQEKVRWLERIFSNDPLVRRRAMEENLPQPLFESREEFRKAIDELLATRKGKEDAANDKRVSLSGRKGRAPFRRMP